MRFSPQVFVLCTAGALISGCGQGGRVAPLPGISESQPTLQARDEQHQLFRYSGSAQSFTVPAGVTQVTISAMGAGNGYTSSRGGLTIASMAVTPNEVLGVFVGASGLHGGYNGGGTSSANFYYGAGASDVREGGTALQNRVVVAGGSGGNGDIYFGENGGRGGEGGGKIGGTGHAGGCHVKTLGPLCHAQGGLGGSQSGPGTGGSGGIVKQTDDSGNGSPGADGSLGSGGSGGSGGGKYQSTGGGGGGGYYGGGGGGGGGSQAVPGRNWIGSGGGGGGGSSYIARTAKKIKMDKYGGSETDGQITISWTASH